MLNWVARGEKQGNEKVNACEYIVHSYTFIMDF